MFCIPMRMTRQRALNMFHFIWMTKMKKQRANPSPNRPAILDIKIFYSLIYSFTSSSTTIPFVRNTFTQ